MESHRFLDSDVPAPESPKFEALGQAGSEHYVGLETFDNPGCSSVMYTSDELVAHCPVTGQPDFYRMDLVLLNVDKCIESKSLKIWLGQFRHATGPGMFCEALAVYIRDQVGEAVGLDQDETAEHIQVTLHQKSRGGIAIRSVA